jgi:hypothetical protein
MKHWKKRTYNVNRIEILLVGVKLKNARFGNLPVSSTGIGSKKH